MKFATGILLSTLLAVAGASPAPQQTTQSTPILPSGVPFTSSGGLPFSSLPIDTTVAPSVLSSISSLYSSDSSAFSSVISSITALSPPTSPTSTAPSASAPTSSSTSAPTSSSTSATASAPATTSSGAAVAGMKVDTGLMIGAFAAILGAVF